MKNGFSKREINNLITSKEWTTTIRTHIIRKAAHGRNYTKKKLFFLSLFLNLLNTHVKETEFCCIDCIRVHTIKMFTHTHTHWRRHSQQKTTQQSSHTCIQKMRRSRSCFASVQNMAKKMLYILLIITHFPLCIENILCPPKQMHHRIDLITRLPNNKVFGRAGINTGVDAIKKRKLKIKTSILHHTANKMLIKYVLFILYTFDIFTTTHTTMMTFWVAEVWLRITKKSQFMDCVFAIQQQQCLLIYASTNDQISSDDPLDLGGQRKR